MNARLMREPEDMGGNEHEESSDCKAIGCTPVEQPESSERGVMNEARLRQLRDLAGNEYYAPKLIQQILDALLEPSERGSEGLPGKHCVIECSDTWHSASLSSEPIKLGACRRTDFSHSDFHPQYTEGKSACIKWQPLPPESAKQEIVIDESERLILRSLIQKAQGFNHAIAWKNPAVIALVEKIMPSTYSTTQSVEPESVREEPQPRKLSWADETVMMINKLTPLIVGKAFDPDWFLLYQRLREFERGAAVPVSEGVTQPDYAILKNALMRIATYNPDCCCDHLDQNCCENVGEYCPRCIAELALQSLSSVPKESA